MTENPTGKMQAFKGKFVKTLRLERKSFPSSAVFFEGAIYNLQAIKLSNLIDFTRLVRYIPSPMKLEGIFFFFRIEKMLLSCLHFCRSTPLSFLKIHRGFLFVEKQGKIEIVSLKRTEYLLAGIVLKVYVKQN